MESSLWEIKQKVEEGEPLTDAEKEKLEAWEGQAKEAFAPYIAGISQALQRAQGRFAEIVAPFKTRIEAALLAYESKKVLWGQDRNGIALDIGYNPDFEEVLEWLIENTDLSGKTLGEFLGYSKKETRSLFDLWGALYPEFRKQERVRMLANQNNPPLVIASTEPIRSNPKTIKKEKDYFIYTNKYVELRRSVNYNRQRAIEATLKEFGISEKTLCRAFNANEELLLKFGHEKQNFKVFSLVKWS